MNKQTADQIRLSALHYAQKHPDDIAPRINTLRANIARLERKRAAKKLGKGGAAHLEENQHELKLLTGFAATLGIDVEG